MLQIHVPGNRLYTPPIEYRQISDAVRRAKQIAAVYPDSTVDIYRDDGTPIFALGASRFGSGCPDVIPHRCWSTFQKINGFAR